MLGMKLGCVHDAPEREVVVLVVDKRWDAAIRIVFDVFWSLLLPLLKVEVDRLVCQAKFLQ